MQRILLVRHAAAADRDRKRWPDDRQRPLTSDGIAKFRRAAAGLATLAGPIERLLTSPLVRARQTAMLLHEVAEWPEPVEAPELAPERTPAQALKLVREAAVESIALVGHEPNLSELLAVCIAGPAIAIGCGLKKGGAASITFEGEARPGQGTLDWLLTPKLLRACR